MIRFNNNIIRKQCIYVEIYYAYTWAYQMIAFSKYSSVIPNPMSEKIMRNDLKQFQDVE